MCDTTFIWIIVGVFACSSVQVTKSAKSVMADYTAIRKHHLYIGDNCNYDIECIPDDSYCDQSSTCACMPQYEASSDKQSCRATADTTCDTSDDCVGMDNVDCSNGYCTCRQGFVAHSSRRYCLPVPITFDGNCVERSQCQAAFGNTSMCSTGNVCVCVSGYHAINQQCVKDAGFLQRCTDDNQCYIGDKEMQQLQCKDNVCDCKLPFVRNDDGTGCSGAATMSVSVVSIGFCWILRAIY